MKFVWPVGSIHARSLAVVATAFALQACGDDPIIPDPDPGAIEITVATAGFLKDDQYQVLLDGADQGVVAADGMVTISDLAAGAYSVDLGDVAANCTSDGPMSVTVQEAATATVTLSVDCTFGTPDSYTLRFDRDRPDLDTGDIEDCLFGICNTEEDWDMWVFNSTGTDPQAVIRQNIDPGEAAEIAHLPGVTLDTMTEADVEGATFSVSYVDNPFDATRVILIKTDLGAVYALGNPVEDLLSFTLDFDAVLITPP